MDISPDFVHAKKLRRVRMKLTTAKIVNGEPYGIFSDMPYKVNEWMPKQELEMWRSGYHYSENSNILYWLRDAEEIWEIETRGDEIGEEGRNAAQEMKLNKKLGGLTKEKRMEVELFAEEKVLPIFE